MKNKLYAILCLFGMLSSMWIGSYFIAQVQDTWAFFPTIFTAFFSFVVFLTSAVSFAERA
jgi:hypothetical protein